VVCEYVCSMCAHISACAYACGRMRVCAHTLRECVHECLRVCVRMLWLVFVGVCACVCVRERACECVKVCVFLRVLMLECVHV